jgi:hypothetical protein
MINKLVFLIVIYVLPLIILTFPLHPQTSSTYFPLDINNKWIFSNTFTDSLTESIVDTQWIGSNLYYQFDHYRDDQDVLFTKDNQKVFRLLDTTSTLWYDFNADTGTTWTAQGSYGVQWTVILLSKTDIITTPLGIWTDCYHFFFTGVPDYEWEEWFAPGVGVVKRNLHGIVFREWLLIDKIITSISFENRYSQLKTFTIYQNYPNPFNPSTTIGFNLPKTSEVTLKVFNILGEEVATLVSDRLSTGLYSYEWDASKLASGVYLYRLETEGFVQTRKMILMR